MGVPFLPVRGILGSAYLAVNPRFRVMADPFSGEELVAVQALTPDVTLIHGARGDSQGNILIPRVSDWRLAVTASVKVIATVEERVAGPLTRPAGVAPHPRHLPHGPGALPRRRRPTGRPGHCPGGAAPTGYPGYYPQDEAHLALYLERLRQVVASGLDLRFSLTGLEERNDRARPGTSFRQVLAAIQTLNRLKAAGRSATPQIHIAYLLLKSGRPDLEKLPQFLEGLGVQQAVISTLDFVPTRELAGESFAAGDPAAHEELRPAWPKWRPRRTAWVPVHYPLKPPGVRGLLCPENPRGALRGGGRRRLPLRLHQPAGISGNLRGARRGTALPTSGLREPPGAGFGGHLASAGLRQLPPHFFTGRLATPAAIA